MNKTQLKAFHANRGKILAGVRQQLASGRGLDSYGKFIPQTPYYVTMTDKGLSGWGQAENKNAKYIYPAHTYKQAEIVAQNARNREDQKNINIVSKKPVYNKNYNIVRLEMPHGKGASVSWYKKGGFKPKDR